jgi:hypothetical protein
MSKIVERTTTLRERKNYTLRRHVGKREKPYSLFLKAKGKFYFFGTLGEVLKASKPFDYISS